MMGVNYLSSIMIVILLLAMLQSSHEFSICNQISISKCSMNKLVSRASFNIRMTVDVNDDTIETHKTLYEQNRYGLKKIVSYNQKRHTFETASTDTGRFTFPSLIEFLKNSFLPSGKLSKDYYMYTAWRLAQRFVSATSSVFGTQALLLALGFKKSQIGVAAATTWVLKDALGKISRILWASENGRKFDSDAKRWRFRSSVLYAIGNGLEVLTYLTPSLFLLAAATANGLKQMALVTSSATRNAIYKSFSRSSDNIGDITAKGEAQLAVVDLLGMLSGIYWSQVVNAARNKIAYMFIFLSMIDLYCIFNEVKSVVFDKLNYQRTYLVLQRILSYLDTQPSSGNNDASVVDFTDTDIRNTYKNIIPVINTSGNTDTPTAIKESNIQTMANEHVNVDNMIDSEGTPLVSSSSSSNTTTTIGSSDDININNEGNQMITQLNQKELLLTSLQPDQIAQNERIIGASPYGEELFRTWSTVECTSAVLNTCMKKYNTLHPFLVVVHMKPIRIPLWKSQPWNRSNRIIQYKQKYYKIIPQILLQTNAGTQDIFHALIIVNRLMSLITNETSSATSTSSNNEINTTFSLTDDKNTSKNTVTTTTTTTATTQQNILHDVDTHILSLIEQSYTYERIHRLQIASLLQASGWNLNAYMYGDIKLRVNWD